MAVLRNPFRNVTDERFRTAVVLGIASIPFTIGINWLLTPDTTEATPVLIACVISGYLYGPRSASAARAGALTGFVGGVPIVVRRGGGVLIDWWGNPILVDAVGDSVLMAVISIGGAILTAVVIPVVLLAVGWVGGVVGGWVNKHVGRALSLGSRGPSRKR